MGKSWDYRGNRRKSSFSQKKKEFAEYEDLAHSGYLSKIANKSKIKFDLDFNDEDFDYAD